MNNIPLTPWLEHLVQHLPIARQGTDPEGIHQLRVAGRRLRVWLELGGYATLESDLAWLVRGAGTVRDLEVLLGDSGWPTGFRKWALGQLKQARAGFVPLLDGARLTGLLQALGNLSPLKHDLATQQLKRFKRRVRQREQQWQLQDDLESLHALRRALRKLRYAREWLELDSEAIKTLQDQFGQIGDLSFRLRYVRQFGASGGTVPPQYTDRLESQLGQALKQARSDWARHPLEIR